MKSSPSLFHQSVVKSSWFRFKPTALMRLLVKVHEPLIATKSTICATIENPILVFPPTFLSVVDSVLKRDFTSLSD